MNGTSATIRFREEDLELFSAASGDRNPLHLSASYASKTAYGQQVVFGALGAVACLQSVEAPAGHTIARIIADFHRPTFLGVDYQVKVSDHRGLRIVRLFDGTVPLLSLGLTFRPGDPSRDQSPSIGPLFDRSEPAQWKESDIQPGLKVQGRWRADPASFATLCELWKVGIHRLAAETLLLGSYIVGMDLPGRDALFFKLSLDFKAISTPTGPLLYQATIQSMNTRVSQLRIGIILNSDDGLVASGQFLSFLRPELAPASDPAPAISVSDALEGKVGLVIGASRGLGAATTHALALQGARVIAASRSMNENLTDSLPSEAAARITVAQGDAANMEWLADLRAQIRENHGRLDYLICNAFPAIPALRLEPNGFCRIRSYLSRAVDTVLAPLCALLEFLNESGGCVVIVSSLAVEKPVREWPHYVAAKNAVEALARVAPMQYPRVSSLIVRPERLLTQMTNTPMGRQNALPPSHLAANIIDRLRNPPAPGTTEMMPAADKIGESHTKRTTPEQ